VFSAAGRDGGRGQNSAISVAEDSPKGDVRRFLPDDYEENLLLENVLPQPADGYRLPVPGNLEGSASPSTTGRNVSGTRLARRSAASAGVAAADMAVLAFAEAAGISVNELGGGARVAAAARASAGVAEVQQTTKAMEEQRQAPMRMQIPAATKALDSRGGKDISGTPSAAMLPEPTLLQPASRSDEVGHAISQAGPALTANAVRMHDPKVELVGSDGRLKEEG
jgi:hypothetical protein